MSILGSLLKGAGAIGSLIPGVGPVAGPLMMAGGEMLGNAADSASASKQHKADQYFNAEQAQLNRDFQRQERLETQQFNIDMWNMNNEYNSPAEKLKRAEAAGINPNAVVGELGGASASPVTSAPMSGSQAQSTSSLASSVLTQDAMLSKLIAETNNIKADTKNKEYEYTWNTMTEKERLKQLRKQNVLLTNQAIKTSLESAGIKINNDIALGTYEWFCKKSEEEINILTEQLNVLRNQALNIAKDTEVKDSQISVNAATVDSLKADTDKTKEEAKEAYYSADLKKYEVQVSNMLGAPLGSSEFEVLFSLWQNGQFDKFATACMINAHDTKILGVDAGKLGFSVGAGIGKAQPFSHNGNYSRWTPPYGYTQSSPVGYFR